MSEFMPIMPDTLQS